MKKKTKNKIRSSKTRKQSYQVNNKEEQQN